MTLEVSVYRQGTSMYQYMIESPTVADPLFGRYTNRKVSFLLKNIINNGYVPPCTGEPVKRTSIYHVSVDIPTVHSVYIKKGQKTTTT